MSQCKNNKHLHYHTEKQSEYLRHHKHTQKLEVCRTPPSTIDIHVLHTTNTQKLFKALFLLIDILGICKHWARLPDVRSVVLHHRHTAPPVSF